LLEKSKTYKAPPASSAQRPKRRAVTLDCEMAGVVGGMGEVILLCAADFITGETLVNALVRPTNRVIDWRTRVSGVTAAEMAAATARGNALAGWKGARAELWEYIDTDTILIGHSLQNDLDVLRIIHNRVVDSAILARNAVGPGGRQWGLKALCGELLGIDIQNNGKRGHDCLEDALAAREVVLWCIRNPSWLADWAKIAREREERMKEERLKREQDEKDKMEKKKMEMERELRKEGKAKMGNGNGDRNGKTGGTYTGYSSDEIVLWEDIAEDCGYPHPDHYDPWSD